EQHRRTVRLSIARCRLHCRYRYRDVQVEGDLLRGGGAVLTLRWLTTEDTKDTKVDIQRAFLCVLRVLCGEDQYRGTPAGMSACSRRSASASVSSRLQKQKRSFVRPFGAS